jgi:hypothetical protein
LSFREDLYYLEDSELEELLKLPCKPKKRLTLDCKGVEPKGVGKISFGEGR